MTLLPVLVLAFAFGVVLWVNTVIEYRLARKLQRLGHERRMKEIRESYPNAKQAREIDASKRLEASRL